MFITFEGGEGVGKTTAIKFLEKRLKEQKYSVITTREPGGSFCGQTIRNLLLHHPWQPLSETFLFYADRFEHLINVVIPALNEGKIVLCDRFSDSTVAYQGYGQKIDLNFLKILEEKVVIRKPDLTFILDLDPVIGQERIEKRGEINQIDQRSLIFHQDVREGFLTIAQKNPDRCYVIDACFKENEIIEKIEKIFYEKLTIKHM